MTEHRCDRSPVLADTPLTDARVARFLGAYIDNRQNPEAARAAVIQVLRELDGCAHCLVMMLLRIGPDMADLLVAGRLPDEVLAELDVRLAAALDRLEAEEAADG